MPRIESAWPLYRCGDTFVFRRRTYRAGEEIRFPNPPSMHMAPLDRAARIQKWSALRRLVTPDERGRRVAHHVRLAQISRSLGLSDAKSMDEIRAFIDRWMADVSVERNQSA